MKLKMLTQHSRSLHLKSLKKKKRFHSISKHSEKDFSTYFFSENSQIGNCIRYPNYPVNFQPTVKHKNVPEKRVSQKN